MTHKARPIWFIAWLGVSIALIGCAAPRSTLANGSGCDPSGDRAAACNTINGSGGNRIASGVRGATISGGGDLDLPNRVTADFGSVGGGAENVAGDRATVAGGAYNLATGFRAAIGGGSQNVASADHTTIAGGVNNLASYTHATIGGGTDNTANSLSTTVGGGSGNRAIFTLATIGGGAYNTASSLETTIGGGAHNTASGAFGTVAGGSGNVAGGFNTAIGGGSGNFANGDNATIGGGIANRATDKYATTSGGEANLAGNSNADAGDASFATVAGGSRNTASGTGSIVSGGTYNVASGAFATVGGGTLNDVAADYGFAVGRRVHVQADHHGAILFADSNDAEFDSRAADEFAVRATGGVRLVTAIDSSGQPLAGVRLAGGSGSWETLSDRNAKANITPINEADVLARLAALPISTWNYKTQDSSVRHIGPMAQDFHAAFGVGTDDKYISTVDINGVALAAIQGLNRLATEQGHQIIDQQQHITALETEIAAQQTHLAELESRLAALERRTQSDGASTPLTSSSLPLSWLIIAGLLSIGHFKASRSHPRGKAL
jgi:hypothetical protein